MNTTQTPSDGRLLDELARWSAGVLLGVMALVAVLATLWRLSGSFDTPLPTTTLVAAAALAAASVATARGLAGRAARTPPRATPWLERIVAWGPVPLVLLLGAALSARGTSPIGLTVAWAVLLGSEAVFFLRRESHGRGSRAQGWQLGGRQFRADAAQTPIPHAPAVEPEAELRQECVQQFARVRSADGAETVCGWLRVEVVPGQRTANAHVAFCPPLARTPEVEVSQSSGPSARIKTAQRLAHGVRFDLKFAQPVESPSTVLLRFTAQSQG